MRITEVRTIVVGTPWRELTFVELETDEGLVGLAEARMVNKTDTLIAAIAELGERHVVGRDPFDTEALVEGIERLEYGRPGEIAQSALALFEIACMDLQGKALGVPVYRLLGGAVRPRIPAYANGWYQAVREPEAMAAKAVEAVARGYRALKLDPFGAARTELSTAERRRSIDILSAVREAVGKDVGIMVECHGRFTPAEAVRVAHLAEELDPEWIEEPTLPERAGALASVRAHTRIPIASGERVHHLPDAAQFLESGLVDILQLDLTHAGGFANMKRLAGWAGVYGRQLAPHNVCGPVGTMANLHLAACTPQVKIVEHFNDFADAWVADLVDHPPRLDPVDGCFALPEGPGLGLELRHEVVAKHPRTRGRQVLFQPGWERRRQDEERAAER